MGSAVPRCMPGDDIVYSPTEISGNRGYIGDKAKGIICNPMPKEWHDRHSVNKIEEDHKHAFYRSIVADKKPYFMRYIYPDLMKQYNTYIKNTDKNALREFQLTVSEMISLPYDTLTDRQKDFLKYYDYRMPVGLGDCVMNKICRIFEKEFSGYFKSHRAETPFDYTIMKSQDEYSERQYAEISRLFDEYNKSLSEYAAQSCYDRENQNDQELDLSELDNEYRKRCSLICPNRFVLCNIVLDMCYRKSSTKRFAWSMCGDEIIHNLLLANQSMISYPVSCENGDFEYCGEKYIIEMRKVEEKEDYGYSE